MPLVVRDRVKETTSTTGTGSYTLSGAVAGFQSFSVIGNGNTTFYAVVGGNDWEVGVGTYSTTGPTLARTTILESSNGGTAINWGAGTKDIFCTYPAERSLYIDGSTITPAISSTLPALYGGTGLSSPGTAGNVLTSNGTGWTSSAPSSGLIKIADGARTDRQWSGSQFTQFFYVNVTTNGRYILVFSELKPNTSGCSAFFIVGTGTELSGFQTSGYQYTYTVSPTNAAPTSAFSNANSHIPISGTQTVSENIINRGMSGFLNLNRINDTIFVQGQFGPTPTSFVSPSAPTYYSVVVTGFKTASSNLNSVGVIFPKSFTNVGVNGNMTLYQYT